MRHFTYAAITALLAFAPVAAAAQETPPADQEPAIRAAVLDYVEAIYDATPERIERSVHPDLAKFGFWKGREDTEYGTSPMSYEELLETARTWNDEGRDLSGAPRIIEVDDILPRIATARLIAAWGVDYMQLIRTDDGWKIRHVVWQSHTPETIARVEAARAEAGDG